jgi:hypothetical protein
MSAFRLSLYGRVADVLKNVGVALDLDFVVCGDFSASKGRTLLEEDVFTLTVFRISVLI